MSKRNNPVYNHGQTPKKPRLDIQKNAKPGSGTSEAEFDLWDDEFAITDNLDMLATQGCSQEVNTSVVSNRVEAAKPSTSTMGYATSFNAPSAPNLAAKIPDAPSRYYKFQPSQKLASSDNIRQLSDEVPSLEDFRKDIMSKANLNSTFQLSQANGHTLRESDQAKLSKLKKLESDYAKLLHDFTSKEGETMFLRQQLQQIQQKTEKENSEKIKQLEQQAKELKHEINIIRREKETMKTEFDLKHLELTSDLERYKVLESKTVKLTTPQNNCDTKSRSFPSTSRGPKVKMFDCSNQTNICSGAEYHLRSCRIFRLFNNIPSQLFTASLPEKSVISPEVMAKRDLRNRPILHDELSSDSENNDLVRPKVTMINHKVLNVEFFHFDVVDLQKIMDTEDDSLEIIYKINKIVATTRELMLNLLSVFEVLITTITNDDIRDMNDIYFSNFYNTEVSRDRSICDADEWHDQERGLEARRAVGVLSYLAEKSKYLANYVIGESVLHTDDDKAYHEYIKQMIRYQNWIKRGDQYEMLEIFHKFVTAINYARRAHQFTGLICAITRLLAVVQPQANWTKKALQYAANIFKELVFSRPLLIALEFMAKMAAKFTASRFFADYILECKNKSALNLWKNDLTFTNDACVMLIYIEQLKRFQLDEITVINITHAFIPVADNFQRGIVSWPIDSTGANYSAAVVMTFIITMLSRCTRINLTQLRKRNEIAETDKNVFNERFWHEIQCKQYQLIQRGIHFLGYILKRDPEFINRSVIVDDAVSLFVEQVKLVEGLILCEIEEEILILIRSFTESAPAAVTQEPRRPKSFKIRATLQKKPECFLSNAKWYDFKKSTDDNQRMIDMFNSVLQLKNNS